MTACTSRPLAALLLSLLAAGPLTAFQGQPPGEGWTRIDSLPAVIDEPGPYFIERSLVATSGNAITIVADDVVLNLNGFTLSGDGAAIGIAIASGRRNVCISNGIVTGFDSSGLSGPLARGGRLRDLTFTRNTAGALVGRGYLVQDCHFIQNELDGLRSVDDCIVIDCNARDNGSNGLVSILGGSLYNCSASNNGAEGFLALGQRNLLRDCLAERNQINGFNLGGGLILEGCGAHDNTMAGIRAGGDSLIRDNDCSRNGNGGVNLSGFDARIERNHCSSNSLIATGARNLIIRNSVVGAAFSLSPINANGPILSASQLLTSSNPHANYLVEFE